MISHLARDRRGIDAICCNFKRDAHAGYNLWVKPLLHGLEGESPVRHLRVLRKLILVVDNLGGTVLYFNRFVFIEVMVNNFE